MADNPTAAATLLTSALSMSLDPLDIVERLRVAPIVEMARGNHAPLDLDADVFRYRILASGRIVVAPPLTPRPLLAQCPRCVRIHADRACHWRDARRRSPANRR
jgi:hypothetical protein